MRNPVKFIMAVVSAPVALAAQTVQRFPRPDFESDYSAPLLTLPAPRWPGLEYLDVLVLVLALALAGHLALRRRSRRGLLALTAFSLLYFGFWRRGCICAVGSIQNVAAAWFENGYYIPLPVLAFFALPLLFTIFRGRTFCAAVCPLGAIQELTVWRPVKLPLWLNHTLGMLPWVYLCLALLFAATGTGYLICRWDPFVGFFRLGASLPMFLFGALLLALGLFVARPYCRFLCPYGVLLGVCSRLARRHVTITPDECIQCRLCEDACPYGAIRKPLPATPPEPRRRGVRRLVLLLTLTPLIVLAAGTAGSFLSGNWLARFNHDVALAREVAQTDDPTAMDLSDNLAAFFTSDLPAGELYHQARAVHRRFIIGGAVTGALLALIICFRLLGLSLWRSPTGYEPDRAACFSCARCFANCPVGRRADTDPLPAAAST